MCQGSEKLLWDECKHTGYGSLAVSTESFKTVAAPAKAVPLFNISTGGTHPTKQTINATYISMGKDRGGMSDQT